MTPRRARSIIWTPRLVRNREAMFDPKPVSELGGGLVAFAGQTARPQYGPTPCAEFNGRLGPSELIVQLR